MREAAFLMRFLCALSYRAAHRNGRHDMDFLYLALLAILTGLMAAYLRLSATLEERR
jgi:hypothetical protein